MTVNVGMVMKRSFFEQSFFEPAGRAISGDDLLWLYEQDKIVILDYPVSSALDTTIQRSDSGLADLMSKGDRRYEKLLRQSATFTEFFARIKVIDNPEGEAPFWDNGWFPTLDAISLVTILCRNPKRYIEVGSGNSTKFARRAISELGLQTKIISIDPHPRAEVDALCDMVIRSPLEQCDLTALGCLGSEDVFFLDSSHRSFQNSDVTLFFSEIIPNMQPGCLYGVHDIFTPKDYPDSFRNRYYNEQYIFESYIRGGADGDQIVFPSAYVGYDVDKFRSALDAVWTAPPLKTFTPWGGAVWLQRGRDYPLPF